MATHYFNAVGEDLQATFRVLAVALEIARGRKITIAPLRDDYIRKFGVWIRGEDQEAIDFIADLEAKLGKAKINFDVLEWEGSQERG